MKFVAKTRPLKPEDDPAELSVDYWLGYPGMADISDQPYSTIEEYVIKWRTDIRIIAEYNLTEGYEYDQGAIFSLHDKYYLASTSGCSCPSPRDTWGLVAGPKDTISELLAAAELAATKERAGSYVQIDRYTVRTLRALLEGAENYFGV